MSQEKKNDEVRFPLELKGLLHGRKIWSGPDEFCKETVKFLQDIGSRPNFAPV